MLKPESGHHCIFINPAQMKQLVDLTEAANFLFRRSPAISIVDLLYAALWRQISAIGLGGPATTLTVVESVARNDRKVGRKLKRIQHHTFFIADDYLKTQSLVCMAEKIRRSLQEEIDDTEYEGWIVDGLVPTGYISEFPDYLGIIICSSLTLPCFFDLMRERSQSRLSGSRRMRRETEYLTRGTRDFLKLDTPAVSGDDLPDRFFCINMNGDNVNSISSISEGKSVVQSGDRCGVVSIDMWLPLIELNRFKALHGEGCLVNNIFFEN
jgi:hypothetical protein